MRAGRLRAHIHREIGEIRNELREKNLHDTEEPPLQRQEVPPDLDAKLRDERTIDGTHNDLNYPQMGSCGGLEKGDLMSGLFAEPLPEGFGFSETAFRIFILMASRRLKSDRFFTKDWNAKTYTEFGLDYIRQNTMMSVLQRHHPTLARSLNGVENAFHPWKCLA